MEIETTIPTLVLVEGESDAAALRALARLLGADLDAHGIVIRSAHGVTNFARVLVEFLSAHPGARVCGLYDAAEERHVRRALASAGLPIDPADSLEASGFFACDADLEDELIRAVGVAQVERALDSQGELASFRRFQAMPQHRGTPAHQQLRRFLGTRATRKIRSAAVLAERLHPAGLPRPLRLLMSNLSRQATIRDQE